MIRVAAIDDQQIVLEGYDNIFRKLKAIGEEIELVYSTLSANELLNHIDATSIHMADIYLIDFKMPEMGGVELINKLKERNKKVKTIIFSSYYEEPLIEGAFEAGANGYFSKGPHIDDLIEGIKNVYYQNYHFNKDFSERLIQNVLEHKSIEPSYNFSVNVAPREKEVAILISKGLSNKEIADKFGIKENTIDDYKKNFGKKTGAKTKSAIIVYCFWRGWI